MPEEWIYIAKYNQLNVAQQSTNYSQETMHCVYVYIYMSSKYQTNNYYHNNKGNVRNQK